MYKNKRTEIYLALLPFDLLAGSQKLEYLATGFVNDLITDLSRFNSLQVISPLSTSKINSKLDKKDDLLKKTECRLYHFRQFPSNK